MKKMILEKNGISLGALACALLTVTPVSAELVYESDLSGGAEVQPGAASQAETDSRQTERELTRTTLKVAEDSVQSGDYPAMVPELPAVQSRSQAPAADDTVEVNSISRSELLRRQRMRVELKNEDVLQERLESLRLKNEQGIADRIMGASEEEGSLETRAPVALPSSAPLEQEVVSSSLVETAPVVQPAPAPVLAVSAPIALSSTASAEIAGDEDEENVRLTISPRLGLSNMARSYGYSIEPRYAAGIDLGVAVSDHIRFDVGYAFSEYGVSLASSNPWVWGFQNYTGTRETLAMKQNVVDAGLKLFVLGEDSRIRPYLGGGGAYAKSYINYDQRIINALWSSGLQSLATDYELDSFLGFVTTGLDVRLTRSISVGANARYYAVLSSRENQSLNNAAIGGYYPGYYGYGVYYSADADKQILGGTMSRAAFYTITGDVTFSF